MISLTKGQKVDLTKGHAELKNITVGLGWDINKYDGNHNFDLDASAFLLQADDKVKEESDFVYYHNLEHPSKSVKHCGDNLTGEGDGDDEQIKIDLNQVPTDIQKIVFAVTIYDAKERKQNFGQISNAFIRVFNTETNEEILQYDLSEDFSTETAVVVGEIYRKDNEWKFSAVGSGFKEGLAALCKTYGLSA